MKRLIAVFAIAFAVVTGSVTTTVLSSPQAKAEHVLHCFYLRLTRRRRPEEQPHGGLYPIPERVTLALSRC